MYANGGYPPHGIAQGFDGVKMPKKTTTTWARGSSVEVAWAISANHGGGYNYRLCKADGNVTEECFLQNSLRFAGDDSWVVYPDGRKVAFKTEKTTEGTYPSGSEWARGPVPACYMCNAYEKCGAPLPPTPGPNASSVWNTQVDCYAACDGSTSSKASGSCPEGTPQFPEALPGISGFGKKVWEWSIMDKVVIPKDLEVGEYLLSWRWDCEESTQVWENCADITITDGPAPPEPPFPPAPAPTPPSPSPKPGKGCKASENPTCKGTPFTDQKSCWYGGCKKCHDDTGSSCDTCCSGCDLVSKSGKGGDVSYCDLHKVDVLV